MIDSVTVPEQARKYEGYTKKQKDFTEFDLRDFVIEDLGAKDGIAYSGGMFRRYEDGVWATVNEPEIERAVALVMLRCIA